MYFFFTSETNAFLSLPQQNLKAIYITIAQHDLEVKILKY